jgi:DNA invertase Pin-like site-specific DNA recombinase
MTVIGYARVSTTDQDLSIQEAALRAAGCEVIRAEKRSGTTTAEELRTVLEFLRAGDTLCVTRIDRLARSIGDLQNIVRTVRARGAALKATEQPIDTSTAAGKCFLDMLGVFAEFETNLRRERQLEGIAKAKAAGVYKGRPASIDEARVRELKARGMKPTDIARKLGIGRTSVWRALEIGGPRARLPGATPEARETARRAVAANADARARVLAPVIAEIKASGITEPGAIAAALTVRGIPTARGHRVWNPSPVRKLLDRLDRLSGVPGHKCTTSHT